MNFLRKVLLVAIAFVFFGNAEGAVVATLDLPRNTPGLMDDNQIQKVCGRDTECKHIVVPRSRADIVNEVNYGKRGYD